MKVTIQGNDLTPEHFAKVIEDLNKEYAVHGLRVKNATCYIRFMDKDSNTIEPLYNGTPMEKTFIFRSISPADLKVWQAWLKWCHDHKDEMTTKKAFHDSVYPDMPINKMYDILRKCAEAR